MEKSITMSLTEYNDLISELKMLRESQKDNSIAITKMQYFGNLSYKIKDYINVSYEGCIEELKKISEQINIQNKIGT